MPFNPFADLAEAVEHVLEQINVDQEVIRETVDFLTVSSTAVDVLDIHELTETNFGASWTGESMGHHTSLAQAHVARALADMVETLTGTRERVKKYHTEMVFHDEDSEARGRAMVNGYPDDHRQPTHRRNPQEPS